MRAAKTHTFEQVFERAKDKIEEEVKDYREHVLPSGAEMTADDWQDVLAEALWDAMPPVGDPEQLLQIVDDVPEVMDEPIEGSRSVNAAMHDGLYNVLKKKVEEAAPGWGIGFIASSS